MINPFYKIRNFFRSIFNILRWIPIIFQDRDWDHTYLYQIIKFKIERMRIYQLKHGNSTSVQNIADKMNWCIKILDRLIEDDFADKEFWKGFELEWKDLGDGYSELIGTKSKHTDAEIEAERKRENDLRNKYRKTLFSILEKRIEHFWD